MTETLRHRGPDASGELFDDANALALGHCRLSILDVSPRGAQPMESHSGRYTITYNGEVYNAPELRRELDAMRPRSWRGHSDTEVVLEALESWGIDAALHRFNGMFAFGLWDRRERTLVLARDRIGIKPLFVARGAFGLAFASELRGLLCLEPFRPILDRETLAAFLRDGVVPDDRCIVRGVRKVAPGTYLRFESAAGEGASVRYWSADEVVAEGLANPFEGSATEMADELERLLVDSVSLRMRSDVPFGAFLSGGIDSSTVVALMQSVTSEPVKTFCIGNPKRSYDESRYAERVAAHLGTRHHTLVAQPRAMVSVVPEIASSWDEPFADSSQVAAFLVSRLTREHVTVALSGDGGDELFAGYNRHAWAPRLWSVAKHMPRMLRSSFRAVRWLRIEDWDRAFAALGFGDRIRLPGDKLYKAAALAEVDTPQAFYDRLRSIWPSPAAALAPPSVAPTRSPSSMNLPFTEQMMLADLTGYLPSDILTKVDRASMAVSLEARVPLLDHRAVELAWRLPRSAKIHGRIQKWILREILRRRVPLELFDRPKTGFGVPVDQWIVGPLRPWAESLLRSDRLEAEGIFDSAVITRAWQEHLRGRGNRGAQLWTVLMFQSWWAEHGSRIEG